MSKHTKSDYEVTGTAKYVSWFRDPLKIIDLEWTGRVDTVTWADGTESWLWQHRDSATFEASHMCDEPVPNVETGYAVEGFEPESCRIGWVYPEDTLAVTFRVTGRDAHHPGPRLHVACS